MEDLELARIFDADPYSCVQTSGLSRCHSWNEAQWYSADNWYLETCSVCCVPTDFGFLWSCTWKFERYAAPRRTNKCMSLSQFLFDSLSWCQTYLSWQTYFSWVSIVDKLIALNPDVDSAHVSWFEEVEKPSQLEEQGNESLAKWWKIDSHVLTD